MKVLVPVDGSENSLRAAEYALNMVKTHPKTEVTLVSVPCSYETAYFAEATYEAESANRECSLVFGDRLAKVKQNFEDAGLPVKAELLSEGDPARVISSYAEAGGFDKIVMGSRGLSPFKGMVLGSVAYKVLNSVSIPVTIIK